MRPHNKQIINDIVKSLCKAYGAPHALLKSDPVDELVRTILSQNTSDRNSLAAFSALKANFKSWDKLLASGTRKIAGVINSAGLANIKAERLKDILAEIKRREGKITLSPVKKMSLEASLGYLRSLKGVGPKTASCVMLFSFGAPVMPVDTHIFRVTKRLGLIDESLNIEDAHKVLSEIVPKDLILRRRSGSSPERQSRDLIYRFHLCIIEHGRRVCKAPHPRCGTCAIYRLCKFRLKSFYKKKGKQGADTEG